MGLKKSKPHRREYDEGTAVKNTVGEIREYSPIHSDNVNCVAAFAAGVCLSGSADKVCVHATLFHLKLILVGLWQSRQYVIYNSQI